uniref:Long intergenic non-protein coding RNA 3040 n=1 Tax=Mandrillus leucophaeus TaxID=9568 RepID=A0A2K5YKK2_MANLE
MMPLAEAGALAQGGGPSVMEWACILPKTPRHKQPTSLMVRASRRSGETSAVLKAGRESVSGRKNSTSKGASGLREERGHPLHPRRGKAVHLRTRGRARGWVKTLAWIRRTRGLAERAAAAAGGDAGHAPFPSRPLPAADGARAPKSPGQVTPRGLRLHLHGRESLLRGLCRPLRPLLGFRESDSAKPASLRLLQHTPSARKNYRIAGARLMRSNYPPPLSSAALRGAGPTRRN